MFYGYIKVNLKPFFGGYGVRKNERDKEKVKTRVRKKEYLLPAFCPYSLGPSYFSGTWLDLLYAEVTFWNYKGLWCTCARELASLGKVSLSVTLRSCKYPTSLISWLG